MHVYQINPLKMETVFANAPVLKRLAEEVNRTHIKLVKTQFDGHMLMKAMAENAYGLQRPPKDYIESVQNGVAIKPKNTDGICLLNESAWHHLETK